MGKRSKVRDGYLSDLSSSIQANVMESHKIICKTIDEFINKPIYSDLKNDDWAMSCLDKFRESPTNKGEVGSVRIYKNGKTYKCEIQITGTFRNHQAGWIESLLNDFIADLYNGCKGKIRQKFDIGLVNKGVQGQVSEYFTLLLNKKESEEIWNSFYDKRERIYKEAMEKLNDVSYTQYDDSVIEESKESKKIEVSDSIDNFFKNQVKSMKSVNVDDFFGNNKNDKEKDDKEYKEDVNQFYELYKDMLDQLYESAEIIYIESSDPESLPDYNKEYNTDMTDKQAKATLRTLSQDIMNNIEKNEKYKVTQYTANIYANIITKNLLHKWANGYKKFSITLDSYQSFNTLEFKIPTMSQDFISRFINGREPINGFLHRIPEIKVKMSPRIFHTMKNPDDAYNFFKAAIQYYDSKIERYSKSLTSEIMKMNHNLKHLVSSTKLSGLVTYPIQLLFVFDDVKMDNKNTFTISKEDIDAINKFIKGIYSKYAAPEKEKKKIVEDVKEVVKALRESCENDDNLRQLSYLPEAVETYLNGGFDKQITESTNKFINEQVDFDYMKNIKDRETKVMYEKFGVKKLKKIPVDLVAYISIEAEAIKDANDKMMIASYCLGKLEIVEWYIELLEVGSKKYIVPHTKPYLEKVRTELLACYKKIMATPIPKSDKAIINVQYPAGYEG